MLLKSTLINAINSSLKNLIPASKNVFSKQPSEVGILFSGGVDSAVVAALVDQLVNYLMLLDAWILHFQ